MLKKKVLFVSSADSLATGLESALQIEVSTENPSLLYIRDGARRLAGPASVSRTLMLEMITHFMYLEEIREIYLVIRDTDTGSPEANRDTDIQALRSAKRNLEHHLEEMYELYTSNQIIPFPKEEEVLIRLFIARGIGDELKLEEIEPTPPPRKVLPFPTRQWKNT